MLLDIEKCIVNDWEHVWDTQYTPDRGIGHKSMKILFLVPKLSVLTIFKKYILDMSQGGTKNYKIKKTPRESIGNRLMSMWFDF